jgi:hypothetical protein
MKPRVTKDALKIFDKLRQAEVASQQTIREAYAGRKRKEPFHVAKLAQLDEEIARLQRLDLGRSLGDCVKVVVGHAADARLFVNDTQFRPYVDRVLENKFKCGTEQQRVRALREFVLVMVKLLDHPLGLDGPAVVFDIDPDEVNLFAATRSTLNSTTIFSAAMIRDSLVARDFARNVRHADCQTLVKAMIHEAVHRLNFIEKDRAVPGALRKLAQLVNEAADSPGGRMGEIYEDDHPDDFARLTLDEHLANADSYRSFVMGMSEARQRVHGASVEVPADDVVARQARVIRDGDTLWDIADDFYGDGRLWETLWQANKDTLRSGDPHKIYPGETVLLPLE